VAFNKPVRVVDVSLSGHAGYVSHYIHEPYNQAMRKPDRGPALLKYGNGKEVKLW
jgi:hypothetical protein